jgi:hypothetical protein
MDGAIEERLINEINASVSEALFIIKWLRSERPYQD